MKKSKKPDMSSKKEKSIQALGKIKDAIDDLNLSDQSAASSIRNDLEALVRLFPKNLKVPLRTIGLCTEAVQLFTEKKGLTLLH